MLKLISHRGNITGPIPEKENHPEYILAALQEGYEVEIDVWFENEKFMLGHDEPQYEFPFELLDKNYSKLWIHCKNLEALSVLTNLDPNGQKVNYFWHENDKVTLTSKNIIWSHPNDFPIKNSIAVLPEVNNYNVSECLGVCSDYIKNYG
jgi:hypothetical protein